jgi:hypothetical protein
LQLSYPLRDAGFMDDQSVRASAEQHVAAIATGHIEEALRHVVEEGRQEIETNLRAIQHLIEHAEVGEVGIAADRASPVLGFHTPDGVVPIQSLWTERGGLPMLYYAHRI